jgi:hypothetical protein
MTVKENDYVIIKYSNDAPFEYGIKQRKFDETFKKPVKIETIDYHSLKVEGWYFDEKAIEKIVSPEDYPEYFI